MRYSIFFLFSLLFSCVDDSNDLNSDIGYVQITSQSDAIAFEGGFINVPFSIEAPTNINGVTLNFKLSSSDNSVNIKDLYGTDLVSVYLAKGLLTGNLSLDIPVKTTGVDSYELIVELVSTSTPVNILSIGYLNDSGLNVVNLKQNIRVFCENNLCSNYNASILVSSDEKYISSDIDETNNEPYDFSFTLSPNSSDRNPYEINISTLCGPNIPLIRSSFTPLSDKPGLIKFDNSFNITDIDDLDEEDVFTMSSSLSTSSYNATTDEFIFNIDYDGTYSDRRGRGYNYTIVNNN